MRTRTLPKEEWEGYFGEVYRKFFRDPNPEDARVELVSRELGDQVITDVARVIGITYDPKDNLLDVALEGLDHLVYRPQEIAVEEREDGFPEVISVVRDDGSRELIRLQSVGIERKE